MIVTLRLWARDHPRSVAGVILGLFILVMVGPYLVYGPVDVTAGSGTLSLENLLGGLPFQAVLTLVLLAFVVVLRWWQTTLLKSPLQRKGLRALYATLAFPLLGLGTATGLLISETSLSSTLELLAVVLLLNFFVGLSEELLFRGFLFGALRHRHSLFTAIIVSSVAFGCLHVVNAGMGQNTIQTSFQVVNAAALGVVFCGLALITNSLWPPIVLHMVWNSYAMMGIAMAERMEGLPEVAGDSPDPTGWSLLLPTIILMIGISIIYAYRKDNSVRLSDRIPPEFDRI